MSHMSPDEAFLLAIKRAGGQARYGRDVVDATQQRVSYIFNTHRRMPAEWVLPTERATGISRHYLRPDIYPPPDINERPALAIGE